MLALPSGDSDGAVRRLCAGADDYARVLTHVNAKIDGLDPNKLLLTYAKTDTKVIRYVSLGKAHRARLHEVEYA